MMCAGLICKMLNTLTLYKKAIMYNLMYIIEYKSHLRSLIRKNDRLNSSEIASEDILKGRHLQHQGGKQPHLGWIDLVRSDAVCTNVFLPKFLVHVVYVTRGLFPSDRQGMPSIFFEGMNIGGSDYSIDLRNFFLLISQLRQHMDN